MEFLPVLYCSHLRYIKLILQQFFVKTNIRKKVRKKKINHCSFINQVICVLQFRLDGHRFPLLYATMNRV